MFKATFPRFGVALLALAFAVHAFEHYESVAFENCLAACDHHETTAGLGTDDVGQTGHSHACSTHEHSPAVLEFSTPFLSGDAVADVPMSKFTFPPLLPRKIELPPRLA